VRLVALLSRSCATFVTRLQPFRLPGRAARQLPDQSTTLWVESSSTDDSRLRGALPRRDMVAHRAVRQLRQGPLAIHDVGNRDNSHCID
jgi:hypothetical protein